MIEAPRNEAPHGLFGLLGTRHYDHLSDGLIPGKVVRAIAHVSLKSGSYRPGNSEGPDAQFLFSEPNNVATNKPTRQQSSNSASATVSVIADIAIPTANG